MGNNRKNNFSTFKIDFKILITILILFSSFIVGIYLQIKSGEQLEKMSFTVQQ